LNDIPEFVKKRQEFDEKFTALYLAGYSCSLLAKKMNKSFNIDPKQKGDFCHYASGWMHTNRVRLGLPPRKQGGGGGISKHSRYIKRCKVKRIKQIPLEIEKLEKRLIIIQKKIDRLQIEKKQLERLLNK
jgi:hypothetical protein